MASDWQIDGSTASTVKQETVTPTDTTLLWRASDSTVASILNPLDSHSGKLDDVTFNDGQFETVDMAGGSNTYSLSPHPSRTIVHADGSYLVDDYSERSLDKDLSLFEVEVTFRPDNSREATASALSQSVTGSAFGFSFHAPSTGQFATSRIKREVENTANTTGTTGNTVELILTSSQARLIAEGPTYTAATTIREVPDGANFAVDNNASKRNTVTTTVPSAASTAIQSSEYVVTDWELVGHAGAAWEATVTLWQT